MESFLNNFFLGLASGVVATLIADNDIVRFHAEKIVRKLFGKHLISVSLISFARYFDSGEKLITHCIRIKSNMWLTLNIPNTYILSRGSFPYDSRAYKPFLYFRSRGMDAVNTEDISLETMLKQFAENITLYKPDNTVNGINLQRSFPVNVAIICEAIDPKLINYDEALNHQKVLGKLYAAVDNPMPLVNPGDKWALSIISEKYGNIGTFSISIPHNLAETEPFGESVEFFKTKNRPPCLTDLDVLLPLWPLRFNFNNSEILISGDNIKILKKLSESNRKNLLEKIKSYLAYRRSLKKVIGKGIKVQ